MILYGVQMNLEWESPEANLEKASRWIRRGAALGADLLVLPEMFATGFSMNVPRASAPRERSIEALGALAKELQVTILFGAAAALAKDPEGRGVNQAIALGPKGQHLATYEKIHPFSFAQEDKHYRGGASLASFKVKGARVVPYICYDLRFPEVFRKGADSADVMVVIANWPEARRHAWKSLLVARAIENQCYVLGVNRVGEGKGLTYRGDSLFVDPLGEVRGSLSIQEGLVGGEVKPGEVEEVRRSFPFLADRRPEIYEGLNAAPQPQNSGDR